MDKIPEGKKNLSKNSYRNQVVSKLKGISRAILDMSIPFAVDVAVETVCKKIEEKLHTFYKNTTINSLITLALKPPQRLELDEKTTNAARFTFRSIVKQDAAPSAPSKRVSTPCRRRS